MMKKNGFTIIETVIAIFIVTAGVVGVYNAFSAMVVFTSGISDKLTASYLAQEGIEIIRNMRDNNWLASQNDPEIMWDSGLQGCQNGCEADYTTGTSAVAATELMLWRGGDSGGDFLNLAPDGFYSYKADEGYSESKFKRKIIITKPGADILRVSTTVIWREKGRQMEVKADADLYNWY